MSVVLGLALLSNKMVKMFIVIISIYYRVGNGVEFSCVLILSDVLIKWIINVCLVVVMVLLDLTEYEIPSI